MNCATSWECIWALSATFQPISCCSTGAGSVEAFAPPLRSRLTALHAHLIAGRNRLSLWNRHLLVTLSARSQSLRQKLIDTFYESDLEISQCLLRNVL